MPRDMGQEQIAPSPAAHARACCDDFCECRKGELIVGPKIPEIFDAFICGYMLGNRVRS